MTVRHPLWVLLVLVLPFGQTQAAAEARALTPTEARERDAMESYLRARMHAQEGEVTDAVANFKKAILQTPEDGFLRREFAEMLLSFQILPEAEAEARQALKLLPENSLVYRTLGQILLAAAKDSTSVKAAAEALEKAVAARPGDPAAAVPYAQALLRLDRAKDAAAALEPVLERGRGHSVAALYAEALEKSDQLSQAEDVYRALLRQDPTNVNITLSLLRVLEKSRQFDQAIPLIQELSKRQPNNLALKSQLGLTLLRARRLSDAQAVLEGVLKVDPDNREALRYLAAVFSESMETDKADQMLKRLQALEPDDPDVPFRRALNFLEVRRIEDAETVLKSLRAQLVSRKADKSAIAQVDGQLAYAAFLRKDYSAARTRALPTLFTSEGLNNGSLNLLLQIARQEKDSAEGLRLIREAQKKGAVSVSLQANYGEFLLRSAEAADQKEGRRVLEELTAKGERGAILAAADAWQRLDRYKEAIEVARKGLEVFPGNPDLLFRLGASLEREKRIEDAAAVFEQLLKARPDHAAGLNYLGYMWADRNENLDRALELITKAVELEPTNGAYLDSLGWVYFRLNQLDKAEEHLLDAARLNPDDFAIEEHLGDVYEKKGDLEKAMQHWKRALTLEPEDGGKSIREKMDRTAQRQVKAPEPK